MMTSTAHNKDRLLGLSSRMGDYVNMMSNRDDLIADVSRAVDRKGNKHAAAAAYFIPSLAEICFDSGKFFDTDEEAEFLNPYSLFTRLNHTGFVGAAVHEASHAAHTTLNIPKNVSAKTMHWLTLLEESRCEGKHLELRPHDAPLLRGTVAKIVAPELFAPKKDKPSQQMSRNNAAKLAALVLARVDTGVLSDDIVAEVRQEVADVLGEDDLLILNSLWIEAQGVEDGDFETLADVADRWAEVVGKDAPDSPSESQQSEEEEEQEESEAGDPSDSSSSDSAPESEEEQDSGSGEQEEGATAKASPGDTYEVDESEDQEEGEAHRLPCGSWTPGELPEDTPDDAEGGAGGSESDAEDNDPNEGSEDDTEAYDDLQKKMKRLFDRANDSAEEEIKENSSSDTSTMMTPSKKRDEERQRSAETTKAKNHVFAQGGTATSYSFCKTSVVSSNPTAHEKVQARALIHALRKAQYRDVSRTLVASEAPPGRMRMSEVARREAQVHRGDRVTATPWKQIRRREVEQPPFTLGVSIDVSGSLSNIQRPVSGMAWALAQATKHVQGSVAVAAWNDDVIPVIKPGRFPVQVPVAQAGGGSSGCALSIQALDGALNLRSSEGVRMLVIVSDGAISNIPHIQKEIDTLHRSGVLVIWANVVHNSPWVPNNALVVQAQNTDNFGPILGGALVKALSTYGR